MISKFFEMLFSKWMTKHDKICLKESWQNDDAWWLKKKSV